jgi:hypothetical protein
VLLRDLRAPLLEDDFRRDSWTLVLHSWVIARLLITALRGVREKSRLRFARIEGTNKQLNVSPAYVRHLLPIQDVQIIPADFNLGVPLSIAPP